MNLLPSLTPLSSISAYISLDSVSAYFKRMPVNWTNQALKGFFAGFVIQTIISDDLILGLAAGALSMMAQTIHAALLPLFKERIGQQDSTFSKHEELLRGCISIISTKCIASAFGCTFTPHYLLISTLLYFIGVELLDNSNSSESKANWLLMFIKF